jgi:ketosteroid isomerase-like protein
VFIDTPEQVYAEYAVAATTAEGRPFEQLYAGRLVAVGDRIVLLREHLDLVKTARALLPNGIADIPT